MFLSLRHYTTAANALDDHHAVEHESFEITDEEEKATSSDYDPDSTDEPATPATVYKPRRGRPALGGSSALRRPSAPSGASEDDCDEEEKEKEAEGEAEEVEQAAEEVDADEEKEEDLLTMAFLSWRFIVS